jgi:hypothetical protein
MSAPSVRGPARELKKNLMILNSNSAYSGIRLDLGAQEGNQHGTTSIMGALGIFKGESSLPNFTPAKKDGSKRQIWSSNLCLLALKNATLIAVILTSAIL